METDYSQPPCKPSGDGWFGHYGMGHWWECIGYGTPSTYERNALPKVQSSRSSFAIAVTQPLSHAHSHTTYLPHSYNHPSFLPHALSFCIPTTKHTGLHGFVHPSGARPIRLLSPARPLRRRRPRGPQTAEILLPDRPARAERALRNPRVRAQSIPHSNQSAAQHNTAQQSKHTAPASKAQHSKQSYRKASKAQRSKHSSKSKHSLTFPSLPPTTITTTHRYLRIIAKPIVDIILNGSDPYEFPRHELLAQGGGLLERDINDIQSALLSCR